MKTISAAILLVGLAVAAFAADGVKMWNGRNRGMELVTIGHKRVTVFLADGRTVVLGIPILVEMPSSTRK